MNSFCSKLDKEDPILLGYLSCFGRECDNPRLV